MVKRPKIIVLTAFGREDIIRRFTDLGADYFVVKPFDLNVLADRIRQFAGEASNGSILRESEPEADQQAARKALRSAVNRGPWSQSCYRIGIPAHFKG